MAGRGELPTSEPMGTSVLNDKRASAMFEFSIRYVTIGVGTPREGDLRYRPAHGTLNSNNTP